MLELRWNLFMVWPWRGSVCSPGAHCIKRSPFLERIQSKNVINATKEMRAPELDWWAEAQIWSGPNMSVCSSTPLRDPQRTSKMEQKMRTPERDWRADAQIWSDPNLSVCSPIPLRDPHFLFHFLGSWINSAQETGHFLNGMSQRTSKMAQKMWIPERDWREDAQIWSGPNLSVCSPIPLSDPHYFVPFFMLFDEFRSRKWPFLEQN